MPRGAPPFVKGRRLSNISDLKAALIVQAASITDTIDQLDCLATIDDWYACRVAVTAVQSKTIQFYSLGGRSVTRQNLPQFQAQERQLYSRILEFLYARGSSLASIASASET